MKVKRKAVSCAIALFLILIMYAIPPLIAPAYDHNLLLTVRFSTGSVPTYGVLLQNLAIWPVTLTDAKWWVTHFGIYNSWAPSEAPIQNLTLLPYQSHSFQFTIYNATTMVPVEYFNGTLTVDLTATIDVFGAESQIHIVGVYNATTSQ
jgi:hypothetical protein